MTRLTCSVSRIDQYSLQEWVHTYYPSVDVTIHILPDSEKRAIYDQTHEGWEYKGDDSFRAFNMLKEKIIYIFVDDAETQDSMLWLVFHELTHTAISNEILLAYYFAHKRDDFLLDTHGITIDQYFADETISLRDDVHENLPEEVFCNQVATRIVGADYSRPWWRERRALVQTVS